MSRTIRNRHNRGRDHSIDLDAARARYAAWSAFYTEARVAEILQHDEKWNAKLHRDGLHSYGWKKGFKEESAHIHRAHWRVFLEVGDWDCPYPHIDEASDKWSWD